jgi:hypothetical protein
MKIEFTNTLDDFVRFNLYHFDHSSDLHRTMAVLRFVFPCVWVLLALLLTAAKGKPTGMVWFLLGLSVLWILAIRRYYRWKTGFRVAKMYSEGENKAQLTRHTLTLSEEGISDQTEFSSSVTKWPAVNKVVEDGERIYVYVSAVSAHVIPPSTFRDALERQEFIDAVEGFMGAAS